MENYSAQHITPPIEEVDIGAFLSSIYRRKILVLAIFLICFALSIFYISTITPRYTASAIIQIEKDNFKQYRPKDIIQSLKSNVFNSSELITELEVLKSRKVVLKVIQKLDLMKDPELGFNSQETFHETLKAKNFDYQVTNRIDKFLSHLNIIPIAGSNLIKINFTSVDPQKASKIVNTVIAVYTKLKLSEANAEQEQIAKWLESHSDRLRTRLSNAEERIQNYKTSNNLLEVDTYRVSESQLEDLNTQLIGAIEKRSELQATVNEIKKSGIAKTSLGANLGRVDSNLIRKLKLEQLDLKGDLSDLSSRYGPKHPRIIDKKSEINILQKAIERENAGVIKSYTTELRIITAKIDDIQNKIQEGVKYIDSNSTHLVALGELERESDSLNLALKTFLESFESFLIRPELKEASIKVISDTMVPIHSLYPNKMLFISLSAFLSLFLGFVVAIVIDKFRKIKSDVDSLS